MTTLKSSIPCAKHWLVRPILLAALFVLASHIAFAAEAPRWQIFAGYSRLQFDSKAFGFTSNTGLNGGTVSGAFNLNPYFGAVGEISVETGPNFRSRDWMLGPQGMYSKWGMLFFGHFLFGKSDTRASTTVVAEDNARTEIVGGGFDFPVNQRISIRVAQVDYMWTHQLNVDQKDVKYSTGVVFHWGKLSTKHKNKL